DFERVRALCPECPEQWGGELNPVTSSPSQTQKRDAVQPAKANWPSNLSTDFIAQVLALHTSFEVQNSVISVMTHLDFPRWMSVGGEVALNPAWHSISVERRRQVRSIYKLVGSTSPRVMRLDVPLVPWIDKHSDRHIFMRVGEDWA